MSLEDGIESESPSSARNPTKQTDVLRLRFTPWSISTSTCNYHHKRHIGDREGNPTREWIVWEALPMIEVARAKLEELQARNDHGGLEHVQRPSSIDSIEKSKEKIGSSQWSAIGIWSHETESIDQSWRKPDASRRLARHVPSNQTARISKHPWTPAPNLHQNSLLSSLCQLLIVCSCSCIRPPTFLASENCLLGLETGCDPPSDALFFPTSFLPHAGPRTPGPRSSL
ncbi:hypothetical protein BU26DRAFT_516284 [Trematosphaeria pertusa]|uniref:Uncharacterized protein n=1 Tax=Trematosphaeria pertusa TaxID=390896 RepID=A0A6A6IUD9_9PLEO|nr:uncharacterized protein BU26DRAFT_516284 [Trematosphaeria pertusa]KAF2254036.1 hypothetical protein BU26DRAFT_516284 [Trematosphaeria pertusa]